MRDLAAHYRDRSSRAGRWLRWLEPPEPLIRNPREPTDFPLGRYNLYVGGAGRAVSGYVNLDLFAVPGVDVCADAERLPFPDDVFTRIECDAVLEHVRSVEHVMAELTRTLAPGGYLHLVAPFCHPFHEYPRDYRRFTLDGLKELAGSDYDVVSEGWRTGPTATLLVFVLEYVKSWFPARLWRGLVHHALGWVLSPLRYLDLIYFRSPSATARLGNHAYVWLRKKSGR